MTVGEWQQATQRSEYNGTNRNYSGNRRNDCHSMVVLMSDFNWCHGTNCHKNKTQDRVRGSKGSKVLRTRRIKQNTESEWYCPDDIFNWFCSQTCLMSFIKNNITRVIALAPRHSALETLINDPVRDSEDYYNRLRITEKGVDTSIE